MDRSRNMSTAGTIPYTPEWGSVNWRKTFGRVRRLQMRIAEAMREGKRGKAHALRRILTRSLSAACMAVRRVTENKGRKTPGVDGVVWSSPEDKQEAVRAVQRREVRVLPLRRIYIPKANGKKRPLGIPTMLVRAHQGMHALGLDPVAEHLADPNSYGFRRERSPADAIGQVFITLAKENSPQWILEGDIRACFDQISHEWMLKNIPISGTILSGWLKAGYVERGTFHATREGTPQGGIISPVICNMTLDGMERLLRNRFKRRKVNLIRFADDFLVTGDSPDLLREEIRPLLEGFLSERGLKLSEEKTRIVHIEAGFDFLGQNVRKYKGKLIIRPSGKSVKGLLDKVRGILKENATSRTVHVIRELNPVIRGWANYHSHVCSKETFDTADYRISQAVRRWIRRRHPGKSVAWIKQHYYTTERENQWVLFATDERGKEITLFHAASVPIRRHVKIRAEANPYDPGQELYFEKRATRKWASGEIANPKVRLLWQMQEGRCPQCGQRISEETRWHVHHVIPRVKGGPDTMENLKLLHPECHRQLHARTNR